MDIWSDKLRALEIEQELQKLKKELRNPCKQTKEQSTTSRYEVHTPPKNDKINRFYAILGVKPGASPKEVKQAYKNLVKRCHPDLFYNNPPLRQKAQEILKKLNEAYEELCSKNIQ